MKIIIDGKETRSDQRDINLIKEKIAIDDDIPLSHVRLSPDVEDPEIKKYEAFTLEHELRDTSVDDIKDVVKRYRGLTVKDASIIWLTLHGGYPKDEESEDMQALRKISRDPFRSKEIFDRHLKEYTDQSRYMINELTDTIRYRKRFSEWLSNVDRSVPLGSFDITNVDYELDVVTSLRSNDSITDIPLLSIFDSIVATRSLPYASYIDPTSGERYYKAYAGLKGFDIPQDWVRAEDEMTQPYVIIKLLRTEDKREATESDYDTIIWTEGKISLFLELEKGVEEKDIEKRLFASLDDISVKVSGRSQTSVKGNFEIGMRDFSKIAFLDIVTNDPHISMILFLNESGDKSALMKSRTYVYYYPRKVKDVDKAVSVILTYEADRLRIRLSRVRRQSQILEFSKVFSKILGFYESNKDDVLDFYRKIIPEEIKSVSEVQKKAEKKTGKRKDMLQASNPGLFEAPFYARQCWGPYQPYILDPSNFQAYADSHDKEKYMEFPHGSGTYYACEPREPGETGQNIYPGLKINKASKGTGSTTWDSEKVIKAKQYEESHPYIPCCYVRPQVTKSSSKYNQYLKGLEGVKARETKKSSYVKTISGKQVPMDREGEVPQNIMYFLQEKGKEPQNYMRYGVVDSPNSFLHCLELAFDKKYLSMSSEEREKRVKAKRLALVKQVNVAAARQEMYDHTYEDIVERLTDTDSYLDPDMFVRYMSYAYRCNILLFVVTANNEKGDYALPRCKNGYYLWEMDTSVPTVCIVKMENHNVNWPYRCEIIKSGKHFTINNASIATGLINVYYRFLSQYIISIREGKVRVIGWKPQERGKLIDDVESQKISDDGKAVMFNYRNGVSMVVSSSAPLNVPPTAFMRGVSRDVAMRFAREYALQITDTTGDRMYVYNGSASGYIVLDGYPLSTSSQFDDFKFSRRMAMFLKEYALKLRSMGRIRYEVIPDHVYDLSIGSVYDLDNPVIMSDGKLIVTSQEMKDRLNEHVRTVLFNDSETIERYRRSDIIPSYYETVDDFTHRVDQVVSTSPEDMMYRLMLSDNVIEDISASPDPTLVQPYFYTLSVIADGKVTDSVVMLQNVIDGDLARALNVSQIWSKGKVNMGYRTDPLPQGSVIQYDEHSSNDIIEKKRSVAVFRYATGTYGAVLFL